MKDASNQEIVPNSKHLSVHTNRHPNCDGTLWGWIDGCYKNIVWANNKSFDKAAADALVTQYNALFGGDL
jgi:hypothetical protein